MGRDDTRVAGPALLVLGAGTAVVTARQVYRVLYCGAPGRVFVLLHAFEKRTEQVPDRDVRIARVRMETYLQEDRT